MPLYEYECRSCGAVIDAARGVTARHDGPPCARCAGSTALRMSAPLVVFRGPGWSTPTTQEKLRRRSAEHTARGHELPMKGRTIRRARDFGPAR